MKKEAALCVPHGALISQIRNTRGFIPAGDIDNNKIFDPANLWLVPRCHAETDDGFKQIIPYLVLTHGKSVLSYMRTTEGTEERLHNRWSIGIGGHINGSDLVVSTSGLIDATCTIAQATTRELHEEVLLYPQHVECITPLGWIYDDSDDVGRVHLGYVQEVRLNTHRAFEAAENTIANLYLHHVDHLTAYMEEMENWSRLITPTVIKLRS